MLPATVSEKGVYTKTTKNELYIELTIESPCIQILVQTCAKSRYCLLKASMVSSFLDFFMYMVQKKCFERDSSVIKYQQLVDNCRENSWQA